MPRGREADYEVVIPVRVRDETEKGAKSAVNNLDRMAQQAARDADRRARAAETASQRMMESEQRHQQQMARDAERFAQQRARDEIRYSQQSAREQVKIHADMARDKEKYAQQAARDQQRLARETAIEEQRLYERAQDRFERAEREKTRAVERESRERTRIAEREARATEKAAEEQAGRFNRNVNRAQRAGRGTEDVGQGMQRTGAVATALITVPFVAAAAAIIKIGVAYEQSMSILQATTRATNEEMEAAAKRAVELGADLTLPTTSAVDAARAMTELAKGGFTVQQSMDAAKGVLQLSAAAMLDEAAAAEIVVNALNAFGLPASEATRIADLLAAAANASSVEITDVAESMQQAGAVFAANKIPVETLVGLIGQLGNAGIKGSDAGTSLKTMLIALTAPTNKAASEMKRLGVEVFDSQGKMKPFRSIVEDMSGALNKMTQEQQASALKTIFGTDAMRAATIIFGQGTEAYDKMAEAVTREGAAADLAAARTKGLGGAWQAIKSQLETLALVIYNRFKAPLTEALIVVAQFVGRVTEGFSSFAEAHPHIVELAGAVLAFLATLGPVVVVVGTIVAAVGAAVAGIAAIVSAVTAAAAAIGGFGVLLAVVAGAAVEITVVLAAIGAAAAVLYIAWSNNFGGLRDYTTEVMSAISGAVSAALEFISELWSKHGARITELATTVFGAAYEVVKSAVTGIVTFARENLATVVAWVVENWPLIKDTIEIVLTAVYLVVANTIRGIASIWSEHGEQIKAIVSAVWSIVKTLIGTAIKLILDVIKLTMQIINSDWSGAWETFKNIIARVVVAVYNILQSLGTIIKAVLAGVIKIVFNISIEFEKAGRNIGEAIVNGVVAGIYSLGSKVREAAGWLARQAITSSMGILKIGSPSKVYFEIGRNVGLSFILGIGSVQAQVQSELQRLLIPARPESASGKGSEKINKARQDADKPDRAGYDLLENLYKDIDTLAPAGEKTRELAVQAELAKNKYDQLSGSVRNALIEAAKYYDERKASIDVHDTLNRQLDDAAKKLLDLKYPTKEGATEVEKFDLMIARLRETSPQAAAALDRMTEAVARARDVWKTVDADEKARKARESAKDLANAVATMADEAGAALKGLADKSDTNLEKLLLKFTRLKDVSLTLAQLDPLKDLVKSVQSLPEPARLNAIAAALEKIFMFSGGRPAGFDDTQWKKFLEDTAKAIDASSQKDATEGRDKAAGEYKKLLEDLNGKLVENTVQSERARIERELETEAYKNLTEAQKDSLRQRASEVDAILKQREAQEQLRETLQGYIDSIEQTLTSALGSLLNGDFKGFWNTIKQGFKQLWQQIITDLISSGIRRALKSVFENIFDGIFGGSGGGGVGGILSSIFGGGRSTGSGGATTGTGSRSFSVGAGAGSFLSGAASQSISDALGVDFSAPPGQTRGTSNVASSVTQAAATGALTKGFSLSGLGASLAPLAPLLGLQLGLGIGGGSGVSGIMGGAGGLLLGGAGGVGLLGGAGASIFATGGSLASLGGIAAFLTNPFTIAAGGLLLVGAYLLNKNKQRRKDEQLRAQILGDAKSQLQQLLNAVNADQIDGAEALSQAASIRGEYLSAVGQIKDKKTRRIAQETVRELDYIITQIQAAVVKQDKRKEFEAKFTPTFESGGYVGGAFPAPGTDKWWYLKNNPGAASALYSAQAIKQDGGANSYFSGLVPGVYDRKDDKWIRVTGKEVVLTPDVWMPIEPYLYKRRVPGFGSPMRRTANGYAEGGGVWNEGAPPVQTQSDSQNQPKPAPIVIRVGVDMKGLVFEVLNSPAGQEVVVEHMDTHVRKTREDGFYGTLKEVGGQG
jgi:TP901 family phage tail tape measure protein